MIKARGSLLTFLFLLFTFTLGAQITKVTGVIYDAETKEPLPFVAVAYVGIKTAVTSDFEGKFSIATALVADSVSFSYLGYLKKTVKINRNTTQNILVYLQPDVKVLEAVTVLPGENPAHRILRRVIKN